MTDSRSSRVAADVVRIIGRQIRSTAALRADADLREDLGLRSLDVLVLAETLERHFGVTIKDAEIGALRTVGDFVALIVGQNGPPRVDEVVEPVGPPGSRLRPDGHLQTDIEISMQLLGINGLAETPLLMRIADLRCHHLEAVAGILTRDVVDDEGDRLYAAVFFVETCFPEARPMGTFVENDGISVVSTLERYGTSLLDGRHYLFPLDAPASAKVVAEGLTENTPWMRISNSFVKKWDGSSWLKKGRPASAAFGRIREVATPPTSYDEATTAREQGWFFDPPPSYVPLTAAPVDVPYDIVPDRDFNGAGLLYFALYPTIMDIAERRVLSDAGPLTLRPELIDRRTLVHRKIAYFSNASMNDRVIASVRIFMENPYKSGADSKEMQPVRLLEHIQLRRQSDDRLMAISSAKKVLLGVTVGDSGLSAALRER